MRQLHACRMEQKHARTWVYPLHAIWVAQAIVVGKATIGIDSESVGVFHRT